jgi:hypothetical protein
MSPALLVTPRPLPDRRIPAAAAAIVVVLALPVFAIAGWGLDSWALAATLWFASEAVVFALGHLPVGYKALVSSGFVGVAMTLRMIIVAFVLVAVAVSDKSLALPALLLFVVAYSVELALSMSLYFGAPKS